MSKLFSQIKIKNISFKNRLGMSPMCTYSANNGVSTDWHNIHYGSRATGGSALIVTEATAVAANGRITPKDLGIWNDEQIDGQKKIADIISSFQCIPAIQLAHAGRKAGHETPWNGGKSIKDWQTIAPSAIKFDETDNLPKVLTIEEIEEVVKQFSQAAVRAIKAGFKIIEIHAAHGYLIHQFLSPLSNKRTDIFGGNFENRIRFLLLIVQNIKKVLPTETPIFVRISATDWVEEGWNLEESIKLCKILKEQGVDLIDVSTGGLVTNAIIPVAVGFQIQFAEKIKKEAGILTSAVGLITTSTMANDLIENQQADFVFLGRELLRNPYFPLQAAKELNEDIEWPRQYLRAK